MSNAESATRDRKEYFDLDEVLETEIKFGKYQIVQLLLIGFPIFLNGIFCSAYIFTAGSLNYRCKVSECENDSVSFTNNWLDAAVPFVEGSSYPEKCERFSPQNRNKSADSSCIPEDFDLASKIQCDDFVYETDEITILNQFKLNCNLEFLLLMIGSINNVGQMFSFLITGILSDKFGRKSTLILGCLGSGTFGILRVLSTNYFQFASFEFLDSLFGAATYSTAYIMALELVTPKLRTIFGTILNCFYALGEIYLGLIAMWLQNYRTVLLVVYMPTFLIVLYICFLPQSVRWLLMKGLKNEVKEILTSASSVNKTCFSETSLHKLNEVIEQRETENRRHKVQVTSEKKSWRVVFQIFNLSYIWFAIIFVYYGLNINAVYLEYWNKYVSFIVVSFIELPSYFLCNIMMDLLGRKKTLFVGMIGSGMFCIISDFVDGSLLKTVSFIIGKMLITISFSCIYMFTIEMFPTKQRHRFFGICSMVGRFGSILTPLTPLLAQNLSPRLPLIIFSSLSFTSTVCLCTLPETLNRKLPETLEEAFE